jgi:hypothetical protein
MYKKLIFLTLASLFFLPAICRGQIPNEIFESLNSGNAKVLSDYFNQNVELVILENDNVYSKAQAQQIVSKFFAQYKPEKFTIIKQSPKEGSEYVIGNLVTKLGSFRVYFLIKKDKGKSYIHHLKFEKQG